MPPDPRRPPPTPTWVKIVGIAVLLFAAAVAALHLSGHGIGGHAMH